MKKILSFLLLAVLCAGFVSCSKDEGTPVNSSDLIGRWEGEWNTTIRYNSDNSVDEVLYDAAWQLSSDLVLNEDGTAVVPSYDYSLRWVVSGQQVYFLLGNPGQGNGPVLVWNVITLTDSDLVVEEVQEGASQYIISRSTWKKIR